MPVANIKLTKNFSLPELAFSQKAVDHNPDSLKAAKAAINDTEGLLLRLRVAREHYERKYVGRDESSMFWKGLVNRWNKALALSQNFL